MTDRYILDKDHKLVPCDDLREWGIWCGKDHNRRVTETHIQDPIYGDIHISTVFLGLDHSFGGPEPICFETMIFGGEYDGEMIRWASWDKAMAGHIAWVIRIKNGIYKRKKEKRRQNALSKELERQRTADMVYKGKPKRIINLED